MSEQQITVADDGAVEDRGPRSDPLPPGRPAEEPFRPRRFRKWWHVHLPSEERQRVMTELAVRRQDNWAWRFTVMTTLSIVVAVMGLSADSAAVVIGAMLLAPLMQPVLATAACISMALFRKAILMFMRVALATAWGIALSYWLSAMFVNGDLPQEITSRTAPDLRDLVVALGAGAAGAYAIVRKDVSASLPGVAVAVALVPPLAVVGICLQTGDETFARGAMLLYTTNLAAIILVGVVVFVLTGFVPPRRLASTFRRSALVSLVVGAALVAVAIPLWRASTTAIADSDRQLRAQEIVEDWLGLVETSRAPEISFTSDRILVEIRSTATPPDLDEVRRALQDEFGDERSVSIEWVQLEAPVPTSVPETTTTAVSTEDRLRSDVTRIVDEWLADEVPDGGRVDALSIVDGVVRLDITGVGDPPSVASLTERLDAEIDQTLEVRITWLSRESVADEPEPTPTELLDRRVAEIADEWAAEQGVVVLAVSVDGETAVVEVAGVEVPDTGDLVAELDELLGADGSTTVLFTERRDITTSAASAATTTTVAQATTATTEGP